jgi:hypothetical protein
MQLLSALLPLPLGEGWGEGCPLLARSIDWPCLVGLGLLERGMAQFFDWRYRAGLGRLEAEGLEAGVFYSSVLSGSIRGGMGMIGSDSTKGDIGILMLRR